MSGFPWGAALKAAARMGIGPDAFWRMSLKEWRLMMSAGEAMRREDLVALTKRFPDGGVNGGNE